MYNTAKCGLVDGLLAYTKECVDVWEKGKKKKRQKGMAHYYTKVKSIFVSLKVR